MKVHVRATLVRITEWTRDRAKTERGFADCMAFARQVKERLEDCTFRPEGLPFDYEFDLETQEYPTDGYVLPVVNSVEEQVKDYLLDQYIEEYMPRDYVIPVDCDFRYASRTIPRDDEDSMKEKTKGETK